MTRTKLNSAVYNSSWIPGICGTNFYSVFFFEMTDRKNETRSSKFGKR